MISKYQPITNYQLPITNYPLPITATTTQQSNQLKTANDRSPNPVGKSFVQMTKN
ncbi:hypothetical protein [Mastigocoleus testarum]|uniref:hypothetical protein n=1 Tax=Mastigocoleus testarum TaxID=996925 RepID=UPI000A45D737|nr:hypothetical protein [Mastigocoleus testarum]